MLEIEQIQQAIATLESQRSLLGDAAVDAALMGLRQKLAELKAGDTPMAQRKQVTILFADVSGFTALSETLDAEEVHDLMNTLWERLDNLILQRGGHIDKHMGDAVMGIWGVHAAREDDAEQCVRTALEMQSELGNLTMNWPQRVRMRVGIHTGPVLLGLVGTTNEFTATGDAVNLTSRLQNAAPIGGVIISHDTYRQIRGIFDVQPQELITLKGKSEPVQTYIVQRAKPRSFRMATRGIEGIQTPMIGRESELNALQQAFEATTQRSQAQLISIVGDAGIGKSRLLYEFESWLDDLPEPVYLFQGRATPEMQSIPYGILRNMFSNRFDILESDHPATVRAKFESGMAGSLQSDQTALVGQLVGFDFSATESVQNLLGSPSFARLAQAYLVTYFRTLTSAGVLSLFMEDIHWADSSSLQFLENLVENLPDQRVIIMCLTRPILFERQENWGQNAATLRIDLQPLSPKESRCLVAAILHKVEKLPEPLRELIVQNAEGNPFYVEELIKTFIESGVILPGQERWQVQSDQLQQVHVPATLMELLQARLDGLPRTERELLQRAAVVGQTFWDATLDAMHAPGETVPSIQPLLKKLEWRELIFRQKRSSFAGAKENTFKHSMLREASYESVLLKLRRIYHRQVAEWIEDHSGGRLLEHAALIAGHYEQAGERTQASSWLRRLGDHALSTGAVPESIAAFEHALVLLPDNMLNEQAELQIRLGNALERTGDYEPAAEYLQQALAYGQKLQADGLIIEARLGLGRVFMRQGDYEQSIQYNQAALLQTKNPALRAQAERVLGIIAYYQAEYPQAIERISTALDLEQKAGNRAGAATCLSNLGLVSLSQGNYPAALRYFEQSLAIHRELGDRAGISVALGNLGMVYEDQSDLTAAQQTYLESLQIAHEIGDRRTECSRLNSLGSVALSLNDLKTALSYFEDALALARQVNDPMLSTRILMNMGWGSLLQQDFPASRRYSEESLALAEELGDRESVVSCLTNLGHAAWPEGDWMTAGRHYRRSIAEAREIGALPRLLEAVAGLAGCYWASQQSERAAELLGLAQNHPATNSDVTQAANFVMPYLQKSLPEDRLQAALTRGHLLDLDTVIDSLLQE